MWYTLLRAYVMLLFTYAILKIERPVKDVHGVKLNLEKIHTYG